MHCHKILTSVSSHRLTRGKRFGELYFLDYQFIFPFQVRLEVKKSFECKVSWFFLSHVHLFSFRDCSRLPGIFGKSSSCLSFIASSLQIINSCSHFVKKMIDIWMGIQFDFRIKKKQCWMSLWQDICWVCTDSQGINNWFWKGILSPSFPSLF